MPDWSPALKAKNMTNILNADLLEATRLTSAGRLTEATAALQRMLGGGQATPGVMPATATSAARRGPPTLDGVAELAETVQAKPVPQPRPAAAPGNGAGRLPFSLARTSD